jgi:hypothetical protein
MEDIRTYGRDEDEKTRRYEGDDRPEYTAGPSDDEVPFHIPRD